MLGVLLLTLVDARGASAHTRSAVWNGVMQVATSEWGRDRADIDLLLEATTELMAASPTFNQLVDALKSSPHLTLFVRPTTSREHLGRGRFYLSEGWTIGFMEINVNRLEPRLRVRAIAHELAHAFEIACRCTERPSMSSERPVETPFASAVEEVVLREHLRSPRRPATGQLPTLTTRYGLHRLWAAVTNPPE